MAERSPECSQCKRPAKVIYKEIVGGAIITTEMCSECPILERKLHGGMRAGGKALEGGGLFCAKCHTSLEAVKMGSPVGCMNCYAVFGDLLIQDLLGMNALPPNLRKPGAVRRGQPLHLGRSTAVPLVLPESSKLSALTEALNEALKRENYEQAAWLRDQIRQIKKKEKSGKEKSAS